MKKNRIIQVSECRFYTIEGIVYYLKHRKELKKETLAVALTTRDDTEYSTRSLLSVISLIFRNNYFMIKDGTKFYVSDPLLKLERNDVVGSVLFMCCRYWKYDGEKMYFLEDR